MTLQRALRFSLFILACAFVTIPAHADEVSTYQITGSFTMVGYNVCSGPCEETFDFSFLATLTPVPGPVQNVYQIAQSSVVSSAYGALGNFSSAGGGISPAGYLGFFLGTGMDADEIDLTLNGIGSGHQASLPITLGSVELYTCASAACVADFCDNMAPCCPVPDSAGCQGDYAGAVRTINDQLTVTPAIPEPSTLALLFFGILCVGLLAAFHKRVRPVGPDLPALPSS